MKRLTLLLATVATLFSVSSCFVTYESLEPYANKAWQGKTHAQIVQTYGAPTREVSDGQGGTILCYEQSRAVVNTTTDNIPYGGIYGFYYHMSANTRTETTIETDYANFFVGKDKICYKVETNLQREVKEDNKKK